MRIVFLHPTISFHVDKIGSKGVLIENFASDVEISMLVSLDEIEVRFDLNRITHSRYLGFNQTLLDRHFDRELGRFGMKLR